MSKSIEKHYGKKIREGKLDKAYMAGHTMNTGVCWGSKAI